MSATGSEITRSGASIRVAAGETCDEATVAVDTPFRIRLDLSL